MVFLFLEAFGKKERVPSLSFAWGKCVHLFISVKPSPYYKCRQAKRMPNPVETAAERLNQHATGLLGTESQKNHLLRQHKIMLKPLHQFATTCVPESNLCNLSTDISQNQ
jgi:hypothetical protein